MPLSLQGGEASGGRERQAHRLTCVAGQQIYGAAALQPVHSARTSKRPSVGMRREGHLAPFAGVVFQCRRQTDPNPLDHLRPVCVVCLPRIKPCGAGPARGGWPLPACGKPMRIKPHQTDSTTFAQNVAQRLSTRIHDPARSASAYRAVGNWVGVRQWRIPARGANEIMRKNSCCSPFLGDDESA